VAWDGERSRIDRLLLRRRRRVFFRERLLHKEIKKGGTPTLSRSDPQARPREHTRQKVGELVRSGYRGRKIRIRRNRPRSRGGNCRLHSQKGDVGGHGRDGRGRVRTRWGARPTWAAGQGKRWGRLPRPARIGDPGSITCVTDVSRGRCGEGGRGNTSAAQIAIIVITLDTSRWSVRTYTRGSMRHE
jgi:hypothetical protein